jgi:hypothetical protein
MKCLYFYLFLWVIFVLLDPDPDPALQNMKILYFLLYLWVIFALPDPDPATQINADPYGSRSTTLVFLTYFLPVHRAFRVLKFVLFLVLSSSAGYANPHHFHAAAFHIDSNPDPDVITRYHSLSCDGTVVEIFTVGTHLIERNLFLLENR